MGKTQTPSAACLPSASNLEHRAKVLFSAASKEHPDIDPFTSNVCPSSSKVLVNMYHPDIHSPVSGNHDVVSEDIALPNHQNQLNQVSLIKENKELKRQVKNLKKHLKATNKVMIERLQTLNALKSLKCLYESKSLSFIDGHH